MTRTPLTALLFAALLGAQASLALAAGTGPTNPSNGVPDTTLPGAGVDVPANPPTGPAGTDPRTQGNDTGRQGGMDTDGTQGRGTDGTGSESGREGSDSNNSGGVSGPAGS